MAEIIPNQHVRAALTIKNVGKAPGTFTTYGYLKSATSARRVDFWYSGAPSTMPATQRPQDEGFELNSFAGHDTGGQSIGFLLNPEQVKTLVQWTPPWVRAVGQVKETFFATLKCRCIETGQEATYLPTEGIIETGDPYAEITSVVLTVV